jgi:hypothetical protein
MTPLHYRPSSIGASSYSHNYPCGLGSQADSIGRRPLALRPRLVTSLPFRPSAMSMSAADRLAYMSGGYLFWNIWCDNRLQDGSVHPTTAEKKCSATLISDIANIGSEHSHPSGSIGDYEITSRDRKIWRRYIILRDLEWGVGSTHFLVCFTPNSNFTSVIENPSLLRVWPTMIVFCVGSTASTASTRSTSSASTSRCRLRHSRPRNFPGPSHAHARRSRCPILELLRQCGRGYSTQPSLGLPTFGTPPRRPGSRDRRGADRRCPHVVSIVQSEPNCVSMP